MRQRGRCGAASRGEALGVEDAGEQFERDHAGAPLPLALRNEIGQDPFAQPRHAPLQLPRDAPQIRSGFAVEFDGGGADSAVALQDRVTQQYAGRVTCTARGRLLHHAAALLGGCRCGGEQRDLACPFRPGGERLWIDAILGQRDQAALRADQPALQLDPWCRQLAEVIGLGEPLPQYGLQHRNPHVVRGCGRTRRGRRARR